MVNLSVEFSTLFFATLNLNPYPTIQCGGREKEGMMEYVYQYDNLQKQLQLLQ